MSDRDSKPAKTEPSDDRAPAARVADPRHRAAMRKAAQRLDPNELAQVTSIISHEDVIALLDLVHELEGALAEIQKALQ